MLRRILIASVAVSLAACQLITGVGGGRTPAATIGLPTARPSSTSSATAQPPKSTFTVEASREFQEQGLRPQFAEDASLNPGWTRYAIEVEVDFDPGVEAATIDGRVRIGFTNPIGQPLRDVRLMLWPNDPQYRSEMSVGPAIVDGEFVEPVRLLGGLAISLPLEEPLEPGQTVDISLPFHIDTSGPIGGNWPRRFGITEGVLLAPTFYPLVPRLIDGAWEVEPAPPGGDTTNSEIALYDVTIHAPQDLALMASGVEIEPTDHPDGTQTVRTVTGPMRDVAFALGDLDTQAVTVGEVELRAWYLPEHTQSAEEMLEAAVIQFETLSELIGEYPYPELDIVDAPGAFGGIEYPGLVFIGTLGGPNVIEPTVHEVGHQWFYGLVGDDQLHEPWLDEAAATYTEILYYEAAGRQGRATGLLSQFRSWLRSYEDPTLPIGLGVGEYGGVNDYALVVYIKGALFFDAFRRELGEQRFSDFLKTYFDAYRYRIADGEDFQRLAEDVCACDLSELFDLWVWQGGPIPELE
ncbi:MAG TPA: M1 family metallopeptidase [Anaerolineales bacterium]|nr:M1 family metallopeptidase [Anaerolineales bacterium]